MIHINERYAITADEKQFILVEKVTRRREKDGERDGVAWKAGDEYAGTATLGYYMTVSDALAGLYRRRQREAVQGSEMTVEEAMRVFCDLHNEIVRYEVKRLTEVERL